ncbi:hypothetical protein HYV43_02105 [Candidatus Micrarchaeota archaeon]|nr:hypothetical protein [Candidatus Micrarchaeota archaeon]
MAILNETLERLLDAVRKKDMEAVKEIGSDAARDALVHENEELLETSLVAYSLYKLSQKHYIRRSREWAEFVKQVEEELFECTEDGDAPRTVHRLMERVHELSQKFGRFAQSTVEKGRLKAAAQMYAHGASLAKAAQLSGAPLSEAASYIGGTKIAEKYETISIPKRLDRTRGLFA